jgi:hypothetical protein
VVTACAGETRGKVEAMAAAAAQRRKTKEFMR